MLSVGVENDDEISWSIQPVTQARFDRLALSAIDLVNDYLGPGFSRALRRLIGGAVIDDENVIELPTRAANDVANVFLFVVSGNDRRDFCVHPSADNRMKIRRVIRAAHERTGRDVLESFFARDLAVEVELLRRDESDDRQMIRRRPQILAHG